MRECQACRTPARRAPALPVESRGHDPVPRHPRRHRRAPHVHGGHPRGHRPGRRPVRPRAAAAVHGGADRRAGRRAVPRARGGGVRGLRPRRHRRARRARSRRGPTARTSTTRGRPGARGGSGASRARALARPHAGLQGHGPAVHAAVLQRGARAGARQGRDRPGLPHPGRDQRRHRRGGAQRLRRSRPHPHLRLLPRRRRLRPAGAADGHAAGRQPHRVPPRRRLRRLPELRQGGLRRRRVRRRAGRASSALAELGQLHQLGPAAAADRLLHERLRRPRRRAAPSPPARRIDVCVPTGNFGNILAAWYARRHRRAHRPPPLRQQQQQRAVRLPLERGLRHRRPLARQDAVAVDGHPHLVQPRAAAVRPHRRPGAHRRLDEGAQDDRPLRRRRRDPRHAARFVHRRVGRQRHLPAGRSAACSASRATCSTRTRPSPGRPPSGSPATRRCSSRAPRTGASSPPTSCAA